MSQHGSTTETFEEILESGRELLATGRDEYEALEGSVIVPERLGKALDDLERELDELDQRLEVTDEDITLAQETVRRITLLTDVLAALGERQRTVVEADATRLQRYLSGIAELARQYEGDGAVRSDITDVERKYSMVEKLIESDRHEQVVTNDRLSLERTENAIRQLDRALERDVPATSRAKAYIKIAERILDDIHSSLSELGEKSDDRTAHSTELRTVKEKLKTASNALENDSDDDAVGTARITLEGCFMIHYLVARAHARQRVTSELATIARNTELTVDCSPDECVRKNDMNTILTAITDTVDAQVDMSTNQRIRLQLAQHGGSTMRTVNTTDFDVPTVLDHLEQLHKEDEIEDIVVNFDT